MAVSRDTVVADTASREAMAIAAMEDKEPMEVSREAMVVDKEVMVDTKVQQQLVGTLLHYHGHDIMRAWYRDVCPIFCAASQLTSLTQQPVVEFVFLTKNQ